MSKSEVRRVSCPLKSRVPAALIVGIWVVLGLLSACSQDVSGGGMGEDQRKKVTVPVAASDAVQKTVPVQLRAIGNVQAYATVAIKSQVGGELIGIHFKEGQEIKKGDPLFTIDPRPFEARLKQAEANLAKNRVQLQNARKQVVRYGSVVKKGYVAEEQYDEVTAGAAALDASTRADEAAVENARLELKYCSIKSPINGFAGAIKVDRGNIVKASDNEQPLVTINQVSPIHVSFSIPEQNLHDVKKYMASKKLEVSASIPGVEAYSARGELTFVDNAVDTATGTIMLKATFPNEDKALWPGQFVQVVLTLSTLSDVVVAPSQAIQTGQQGQYVYVVKPDMTVEYRPVTVVRMLEGESVIDKGVSPGEKVVTDGHLRLAPGSLVKLVENGKGEDK